MVEAKQKQQEFKNTEIGLIPKDWEITSLEKICNKIGDGLHSTPNYSENGLYSFINGNNLCNGKIVVTNATKKVSKEEYLKYKIGLNTNSILLSINGTIGNAAIYNNEDIILGKSAAYINLNDNAEKELIYQLIQSKYIQSYFENELTGTTIKNLGLSSLRRTPILLPPTVTEQKAIATALNDTDELISKLEKLIAKKRAIKQGAMQELLKPKEGWDIKSIKKIVSTPVTDGPHETPSFFNIGIPFLSVNNLSDNKIDYKDLRYISLEDHLRYSKKCKPQRNDILLGKAASVGKAAIVETDLEFNIWSPIAMIRPGIDIVPKFLFYCFQTSEFTKQIEFFTNSSTQGNIGMGDIEKFQIAFPSDKKEQEKITVILSDMDCEVESLEKNLEKFKLLKQGMMQNLLTGKIRLV